MYSVTFTKGNLKVVVTLKSPMSSKEWKIFLKEIQYYTSRLWTIATAEYWNND